MRGYDSLDRTMVAERFGSGAGDGRTLISDDYPDYKLIILGDRLSTTDTPSYQFYNVTTDFNEGTPLNIPDLTGTALAAYNHLIAKDAALGGGYSDSPSVVTETLYFDLTGQTNLPPLIYAQGPNVGTAYHPTSVTIGGQPATLDLTALTNGNPASRVDSAGNPNQFSVKASFSASAAGLASGTYSVVIVFPPTTNPRTYTLTGAYTVP